MKGTARRLVHGHNAAKLEIGIEADEDGSQAG
jgi:hypothetical protein